MGDGGGAIGGGAIGGHARRGGYVLPDAATISDLWLMDDPNQHTPTVGGRTWSSGGGSRHSSLIGQAWRNPVGSTSAANLGVSWSMSAWVRRRENSGTGYGDSQVILCNRSTLHDPPGFRWQLNGAFHRPFVQVELAWNGTSYPTYNINSAQSLYEVPLDEWVHLAATCDATEARLYVNGAVSDVHASPNSAINSTRDWHVGWMYIGTGTNYFRGDLDEVAVARTTCWTAAEVRGIYRHGLLGLSLTTII
jgi:hypothetical protein